jgi:hypothetical protein
MSMKCAETRHISAQAHQPEVLRRDVLAAGLQAVVYRHVNARPIETDVDATFISSDMAMSVPMQLLFSTTETVWLS